MKLTSVTAHAFGPLHDQHLELNPALTVIVGGNESAKSSWHAAIYSAICGRKRGKGRPGTDEQRFIDLHKPWDTADWEVSARLTLDDGRTFEMHHDLAGKVDCQALETPFGVDVSNTIIFEGAPDASVWLGLNRRAFAATACIAQADLLGVLDSGDALADLLSKAAASAGVDESTAKALERIAAFRSEHVGVDRVAAVKPLRRALDELATAERALAEARTARAQLDERAISLEAAARSASDAAQQLRYASAARAMHNAAVLREREGEASELAARLGPDRPASAAAATGAITTVSSALTAWSTRPSIPEPGENPDVLRAELDELPEDPAHDLEVGRDVALARRELTGVNADLDAHDRLPGRSVLINVDGPSAAQITDLADRLARTASQPGAHATPTPPPSAGGKLWAAVAAAGAAAGIAGAIASLPALIVLGALLAVAGVVLAVRSHSRDRGPVPAPARNDRDRDAVLAECAALGLAPDLPSLYEAAADAKARAELAAEHARRVARRAELAAARDAKADELATALTAHGYPCERDTALAHAEIYEQHCLAASAQARLAARLPELTARLSAALATAGQRRDSQAAWSAAQAALNDAAQTLPHVEAVQDAAGDPDKLALALADWLGTQRDTDEATAAGEANWTRLDKLLGDASLPDLMAASQTATARADELARGLDPAHLRDAPVPDDDTITSLSNAAADAAEKAAAMQGAFAQSAADIADVAACEERVAAATTSLERVTSLADVLEDTREFMAAAQARVHRDIAPALQASLVRWLPTITAGRYGDALVDPKSLEVKVCGPSRRWRPADRLSYGTAEQIYLLLRLALVEHLTAGHDTCPLLLDDVTVHADAARTAQILDLVAAVSTQRQVIVFTQQAQVADWARAKAADGSCTVVELAAPHAT